MANDFGGRIKKFREEKGMSLEELSIRIGVSKPTIFKYENNIIKDIPYKKIIALAQALSVEPWQLMGWNPPNSRPLSDMGLITIPFISQRISAGIGEELLAPSDIVYETVDVLKNITHGAPKNTLLAARVKGDSMINVYLYPDDIVIFSKGLIDGDGIYVLAIDNEVLVKRLEFNPLEKTLDIISENEKYKRRTASLDNQSLVILGKVVSWIHSNSY